MGFGPCFSSNVAVQPCSPARDHRLGGPLPRQLPKPMPANPIAINLYVLSGIRTNLSHKIIFLNLMFISRTIGYIPALSHPDAAKQ